jgi:hypothetical protein
MGLLIAACILYLYGSGKMSIGNQTYSYDDSTVQPMSL